MIHVLWANMLLTDCISNAYAFEKKQGYVIVAFENNIRHSYNFTLKLRM